MESTLSCIRKTDPKKANKMKVKYCLALTLCLIFTGMHSYAQEKVLQADAYKILSSWTYEDVEQHYGQGENIIDSMYGQAYISGFRYNDTWFNRPCELEFYFSDVNVSQFLLRFIHPNNLMLEEEDKKKQEASKTGKLKSNIIPDSVWTLRIKENPEVLDSLEKVYIKGFLYRMSLFEQDSLRGDSIIRDLAEILGPPLREGVTPHTDKDSRYFATWIKNGFSCSVKDYRRFTEVYFAISPAPGAAISEFNLDPETKLIEKVILFIRNKPLEISLIGLPAYRGSSEFTQINILAKTYNGGLYLDELPEERQGGKKPLLHVMDLTGDGIQDIWLQFEKSDGSGCTNNFIYTMELIEPLLIFDPIAELDVGLDGDFQDEYMATVLLDGYPRTSLPLDKNDPVYQGLFDENGKLLKPVKISVGSIKTLEAKPYKSKKGYQFIGYMPITGLSESNIIGYVQVIWDYNTGGWELRSLEIWQD